MVAITYVYFGRAIDDHITAPCDDVLSSMSHGLPTFLVSRYHRSVPGKPTDVVLWPLVLYVTWAPRTPVVRAHRLLIDGELQAGCVRAVRSGGRRQPIAGYRGNAAGADLGL